MGNDYWNRRFKAGKVWGVEPSGTALIASDYFRQFDKKSILVIGSGYGRHTSYFYDKGYEVDGIEYSKEGIDMASSDNPSIDYFHGSVFDMPFSTKKYSAIYCYNVIHLFLKIERASLIALCRKVLDDGGLLFFSAISDEDSDYGIGKELEDNTFETKKDKPVHYYSRTDFIEEFESYKVLHDDVYTEVVGNKVCKLRYLVAQYSK